MIEWKPFHTIPMDGKFWLVYFQFDDGKWAIWPISWNEDKSGWDTGGVARVTQEWISRAVCWADMADIRPDRVKRDVDKIAKDLEDARRGRKADDEAEMLLRIADETERG